MILQRHLACRATRHHQGLLGWSPAPGHHQAPRTGLLARDLQRFLYGDILTISDGQVLCPGRLAGGAPLTFQALSYNQLLYIGINASLRAHLVQVAVHQYLFAGPRP